MALRTAKNFGDLSALSLIGVNVALHKLRVAMVREKCLENEIFSKSGKSQGILWMAREIWKGLGKSGKSQEI